MTIRNAEPRSDNQQIERLRRKRDQAWEMAGLARKDQDTADELRHTNEAKEYSRQLSELES